MKQLQYKFMPQYNYGGEWTYHGATWVKGYAFLSTGVLLKGDELAEHLNRVINSGDNAKLQEINGRFVATGQKEGIPFICTDRTRSFPLFFKHQNDEILISDNPLRLTDQNTRIDETALQEFRASGFTWQDRTLLADIKQCEPAHLILFHARTTEKQKYFSFSTSRIRKVSYNEAFHELSNILENIMQRSLQVLGNAPAVVPLTGGYDSRFLVTWLRQNDVDIHTTFTSGKKSSPEFENAKKVAEKLNLPWSPVYHEDDDLEKHFPDNKTIQKYTEFSFASSSMGFFQDVVALHNLELPPDAIIFGGHSGDVTAGSHIWPFQHLMNKSLNKFYAFQRLFPLFNASSRGKEQLIQTLDNKYDHNNGDIPFSIIQEIDFSERQSKFIVNSCRGYDFFAKGTLLPFFDNEFVDFFKNLPYQYRINKRLYNDVLKEKYFKPRGLNFKNEHQPDFYALLRQLLKQSLPQKILGQYSAKYPAPDYCNYAYIAKILAGKSTSFDNKGKQANELIIEWYIREHFYQNNKIIQ